MEIKWGKSCGVVNIQTIKNKYLRCFFFVFFMSQKNQIFSPACILFVSLPFNLYGAAVPPTKVLKSEGLSTNPNNTTCLVLNWFQNSFICYTNTIWYMNLLYQSKYLHDTILRYNMYSLQLPHQYHHKKTSHTFKKCLKRAWGGHMSCTESPSINIWSCQNLEKNVLLVLTFSQQRSCLIFLLCTCIKE